MVANISAYGNSANYLGYSYDEVCPIEPGALSWSAIRAPLLVHSLLEKRSVNDMLTEPNYRKQTD